MAEYVAYVAGVLIATAVGLKALRSIEEANRIVEEGVRIVDDEHEEGYRGMVVPTDPVTWLEWGQRLGWISPEFCWTHQLPPSRMDEADELERDDTEMPCMFAVRVASEILEMRDEEHVNDKH